MKTIEDVRVVNTLVELGNLLKLIKSSPDGYSILLQDHAIDKGVWRGDCILNCTLEWNNIALDQGLDLYSELCEEDSELKDAAFQLYQQGQAVSQAHFDGIL